MRWLALLLLTQSSLVNIASSSVQDQDLSVALQIIHITDVYTLENFASLKTLIAEKQQEHGITKTVSLLSGDFLMPYLLSSVDGGKGMMGMVNAVGIDYLTWGNHEKDLPHHQLLEREREFNGVWINTNMQSHESFEDSKCQVDYDVIAIQNGDHVRQIALLGILTNSKSLYPPGSFNGAVIDDPWESMSHYNDMLAGNVDLVLPICHLYEAQDERTAAEFDFPLILGGHDHHPVDRIINGTRLLKPGSDAQYARVIDISWNSPTDPKPIISSELLHVQDYVPDEQLQRLAERAYRVLDPLRQTQLGIIPDYFRPLSSKGARSNRVSVASFLGSIVRDALGVDAFIAKGGNIRGSRHYRDDEQFTLELLRSELENVDIYKTQLPGSILRVGLRETWTQPGTGWFQHDAGVLTDDEGFVVSVNGEQLDPNRTYVIATMADFFRSRDGPSIGAYYETNPERVPNQSHGPVYHVILRHMAEQWWRRIFNILDIDSSGFMDDDEFAIIDVNGNRKLDRCDVMDSLQRILGLQTYEGENTLVDYVLVVAGGINSTVGISLLDVNEMQAGKVSSSQWAVHTINKTTSSSGCDSNLD
jgi:2',3'-cyclic-nucleotide 2'-phosphodiesterase (5'-nucleotidase family)